VRRTREDGNGRIRNEKGSGGITENNCGCGCDFVRFHDVLYDYDADVEAET
jgi:hypothetical protein